MAAIVLTRFVRTRWLRAVVVSAALSALLSGALFGIWFVTNSKAATALAVLILVLVVPWENLAEYWTGDADTVP